MERDKMLDVTLSQIEKQFGKGAVMRLGEHPAGAGVSVIPTGSLALDVALGIGGMPARADRRGLRPGGVGEDHGMPAHHRRRPRRRAASRCSSTPSTRWTRPTRGRSA